MPLSVWCRTAAGTPTEPDNAPVAVINSSTAHVLTVRLPILDRFVTTGFFHYPLQLDGRFATGQYSVVYQYAIGGTSLSQEESFEIVAGGHVDGHGLSLFYLTRPTSNFVLLQTDLGRLIRRRNPRT